MKPDKILSLIGLATKAGRCVSGEFMTERETKCGRATLVIVAEDSSDNTKKKFRNMCDYYQVPVYFYGTKTELGGAMGKEFRASMAVTDQGLSDAIRKQLTLANGGSEYVKNKSI